MRQIVQLLQGAPDTGRNGMVALCSDGTMWFTYWSDDDGRWSAWERYDDGARESIRPIPQD